MHVEMVGTSAAPFVLAWRVGRAVRLRHPSHGRPWRLQSTRARRVRGTDCGARKRHGRAITGHFRVCARRSSSFARRRGSRASTKCGNDCARGRSRLRDRQKRTAVMS